jgi:DNA topoisomerase I
MSLSTDALRAHYWTRLPQRGGFAYRRPDGRRVRRAADLDRIARLAIPPAWTDVYVSPEPDAELQAFGRDAAGRLQYRYHADFMEQNAERKWQRLARFADVLPRLRDSTRGDLLRQGWPLEKVLALMTRLLHVAYFRVGSLENLRRYRSHGLTTLHKRHVRIEGQTLVFEFRGKSGVQQVREARDRTLAAHLRSLLELKGRWLFQYVDETGAPRRVQAAQLNAYLRERIGPFTAKDFRTWGGTLTCAEALAAAARLEPAPPPQKAVVAAVRLVAETLGNTPAVARGSYICPIIIERYLDGETIADCGDDAAGAAADRGLTRSEAALRVLLRRGLRPAARRARVRSAAPPRQSKPPAARTARAVTA